MDSYYQKGAAASSVRAAYPLRAASGGVAQKSTKVGAAIHLAREAMGLAGGGARFAVGLRGNAVELETNAVVSGGNAVGSLRQAVGPEGFAVGLRSNAVGNADRGHRVQTGYIVDKPDREPG